MNEKEKTTTMTMEFSLQEAQGHFKVIDEETELANREFQGASDVLEKAKTKLKIAEFNRELWRGVCRGLALQKFQVCEKKLLEAAFSQNLRESAPSPDSELGELLFFCSIQRFLPFIPGESRELYAKIEKAAPSWFLPESTESPKPIEKRE